MHYPLHTTVVFVGLWILRVDVNAAKNGLSPEVLTSFARNIASVLSTTLLNDYQDPPSNQSSTNLLKRIQETQFSLDVDHAPPESSRNSSNASFNRYPRYTRESSSNEGKQAAFQDTFVTNAPQYSKYYNSEAYKPYEFALNRDSRISYDQLNVEAPENVNQSTKDNSIDTDVKTASLHYSNQYHQPTGFGYKPERTHQLPNSNHYPRLDLQLNYRRLSPQTPLQSSSSAETINPIDENENAQVARITRRPFHLNYHAPFNALYYPFHDHAGFYPHDRPVEGESQPTNPTNVQAESNPSRLIDDQSQGQTALAGYDYGPRFHYRHPYYDGFYPGFPGFYPRPFNESFHNHGNGNHGDHNGTNGAFGPYGYHHGPFFHGPKFHGPYVPYNPYYPYFYGPKRPVENHAPENHGNSEQLASPENGHTDGNSTGNHLPHGGYPYYGGFPYYGPYHGFNFHPYPLAPFHGLPYRFGHGFHNLLFPGLKPVPYLNFYHHYPFAHWHPFGGYYPHNNRPMGEKPGQTEKNGNENSEAGPASNSEAEMLSESKLEAIRSLDLSGYKERFSPEYVSKGRKDDRVFNELS